LGRLHLTPARCGEQSPPAFFCALSEGRVAFSLAEEDLLVCVLLASFELCAGADGAETAKAIASRTIPELFLMVPPELSLMCEPL
jgi:hypothetical protein